MSQRVSVAQAAEEIGCAKEYLRRQMQRGEWDLGSYCKPERGQKKGTYFIFRYKLDRFLGIKDTEEGEEQGGQHEIHGCGRQESAHGAGQ